MALKLKTSARRDMPAAQRAPRAAHKGGSSGGQVQPLVYVNRSKLRVRIGRKMAGKLVEKLAGKLVRKNGRKIGPENRSGKLVGKLVRKIGPKNWPENWSENWSSLIGQRLCKTNRKANVTKIRMTWHHPVAKVRNYEDLRMFRRNSPARRFLRAET